MIFDTHAHYDDKAFDDDREDVIARVKASGVCRVMNSGADLASSRRSVMLAGSEPLFFAAVGVHPDEIGELFEEGTMEPRPAAWDELKSLAMSPRVKAVGEIGLDYHWDRWPRELQKKAFTEQWRLAVSLGLPIVIHSRDAAEDTMNLVTGMYESERLAGRELRADLHCYSYSAEQAAMYVRMGLMFGVGGVSTFKNARKLRETIDILPIDRILLETDCPYLAPEPVRGQRNDSSYLFRVAEAIAEVKGLTPSKVIDITWENACRFFGIDAQKEND